MRAYEAIYPGAAGLIIHSFVKRQDALIERGRAEHVLALKIIEDEGRARPYALAAFGLAVAGAVAIAWLGSAVGALAFLGTGAVAVVAVIIRGRGAKPAESRKRRGPSAEENEPQPPAL